MAQRRAAAIALDRASRYTLDQAADLISGQAWVIAGIAAAAWAMFLLLVGVVAARSGWRRAELEGRQDQVRQRIHRGRGELFGFMTVWLLGNTIAVFVAALVIASLVTS